MDKRSLLFFLCLTSSLLFVNHYFSNKNIEEKRVALESIERAKKEKAERFQKEALNKTAELSDLGIVALYEDADQKTLSTFGAFCGEQLITLSQSENPQTLFQEKKSFKRTFESSILEEPLLYAQNEGKIKIPALPDYEGAEYQIVSFAKQNPTVIFGKIIDGELTLSRDLTHDALVFCKTLTSYQIVGVYDVNAKKVRSLHSFLRFRDFVEIDTVQYRSGDQGAEDYYVLENDYQMLVFSTKGGALAEINLPFETKENTKSVVKPIEFDRVMQENHPENDYFPERSFYSYQDGRASLNEEGSLGGYYPLLRRSIYGKDGTVVVRALPEYYALNIVGDGVESANYTVRSFSKNSITFELSQSHRRITKTFSFPENPNEAPYTFDVSIQVEGDASGLWLTSGVPEVELISGSYSPALKYRITRGQKSQVEKISLPQEKPTKDTVLVTTVSPDWITNSNGFLGMILDPLSNIPSGFEAKVIPGKDLPTRLTLIDAANDLYPAKKYPGYEMGLPLKAQEPLTFRVFAGPFETDILKVIDATYSNPAKGTNPDYTAAQSFHGWFAFISEPFAKFLFLLMNFFHSITHSWGISIILLTLALRIMLYPLNAWSIKSTSRMQEIAPELKKIQEKYKKDPKRLQVETMKLYKEKGANPFMGCFPIFIQMPFLIGMFDLLKSTFELRGATFIPGWIDNLTAPDVLFSWGTPIFFFGTSFHLLPVLLGLVMYAQQKFTAYLSGSAPKKGAELTDQQKQQKMMGNIMVILFTVLFYHFPSGLNIYWLSSMVLGMGQQWIMKKRGDKKKLAQASMPSQLKRRK